MPNPPDAVDKTFGELLRRSGKPAGFLPQVGKPGLRRRLLTDAFTSVSASHGPISAEHGQGMIDLHNAIVEAIARAAPILGRGCGANRCQHPAADGDVESTKRLRRYCEPSATIAIVRGVS